MDAFVALWRDFVRISVLVARETWSHPNKSRNEHRFTSDETTELSRLARLSKRIVTLQRKLLDDDVRITPKTQAYIRRTYSQLYIRVEGEYIRVQDQSIYVNGKVDKPLTRASRRILHRFDEYDSLVTSCIFSKIRQTTSTTFAFLLRRLFMDVKYTKIVSIFNEHFTALQIKVPYLSKIYIVDLDKSTCGQVKGGKWTFEIEMLGLCVSRTRPTVGLEFVFLMSEKLCAAYGILDDVTPHALCQRLMSTVAIGDCA